MGVVLWWIILTWAAIKLPAEMFPKVWMFAFALFVILGLWVYQSYLLWQWLITFHRDWRHQTPLGELEARGQIDLVSSLPPEK